MIIRGGGLGASMSRYLIERIEATPNIELVFNTEIVGARGRRGLAAAARALAQPAVERRGNAADIQQSLPVRRRRSRHRLARRLRRHARSRRLRRDRRAVRAEPAASWWPRWRPRCPASSPSATSAPARSSASAAPSARARRSWRRCTAISATPQNRRFSQGQDKQTASRIRLAILPCPTDYRPSRDQSRVEKQRVQRED